MFVRGIAISRRFFDQVAGIVQTPEAKSRSCHRMQHSESRRAPVKIKSLKKSAHRLPAPPSSAFQSRASSSALSRSVRTRSSKRSTPRAGLSAHRPLFDMIAESKTMTLLAVRGVLLPSCALSVFDVRWRDVSQRFALKTVRQMEAPEPFVIRVGRRSAIL